MEVTIDIENCDDCPYSEDWTDTFFGCLLCCHPSLEVRKGIEGECCPVTPIPDWCPLKEAK